MDTRHLRMTGPASDLEAVYMVHPDRALPHPKGNIPFNHQGIQIIFEQDHISNQEKIQMLDTKSTNPLPFTHNRFIGLPLPNTTRSRQINQPGFLSVNEDIYFQ
jgi:hypothetical protein